MSKSKEELNRIKEEVEAVNEKLSELTPEELEKVTGGSGGLVQPSVSLAPPTSEELSSN